MHADKTNQGISATANSVALAGSSNELVLLQPVDPGGYDPYNSGGRFPRSAYDTATSPIINEPSRVDK